MIGNPDPNADHCATGKFNAGLTEAINPRYSVGLQLHSLEQSYYLLRYCRDEIIILAIVARGLLSACVFGRRREPLIQ